MRYSTPPNPPVRMSRGREVRVWAPGRRTHRTITIMLASLVILITVVGSISQVLPNIAAAFEQPLSSAGNAGCTPNNSTFTPASQCSPSTGNLGPTPNLVGSNLVPDLSLPKTVTSNLDSLIGAGGVIQNSSQNLTLYNLAVSMRLLGGPLPHDELIGPGGRTLGSWSFWGD